jgi:hypothetical protein
MPKLYQISCWCSAMHSSDATLVESRWQQTDSIHCAFTGPASSALYNETQLKYLPKE